MKKSQLSADAPFRNTLPTMISSITTAISVARSVTPSASRLRARRRRMLSPPLLNGLPPFWYIGISMLIAPPF